MNDSYRGDSIMPSLVGTTVTTNYLKTAASTTFGTRELTVIKVAIANVSVDHEDSNSLFSKSVRALQQTAEVYAVFAPVDGSTDYFCAIIASQSAADSRTDDTQGFGLLEAAVVAGNGGVATTVTVATIS